MRFLGAGSSISDSVGRSTVLTTAFFGSLVSGAGFSASGFFPEADLDLEEPPAPETEPAREARDGDFEAPADFEDFEEAPFEAVDLELEALETIMKFSGNVTPVSGCLGCHA
jgi:hypothetical protein